MKRIRQKTDKLSLSLAALFIWAAGLAVVSLYFAPGGYGKSLFFGYFSRPLLLLLNFLPVLLLVFLFFFLFNRAWAAVLLSGALVLLLTFINFFKLKLRDDPLLATDLNYISEAAGIGGNYDIYISLIMWLCVAAVVLGTVFCALFLPGRVRRRGARWIAFGVALVLCAGAYLSLYRSEKLYRKTENLGQYMSVWSDRDQYVTRGFLYPLLYSFQGFSDGRPAGYSRAESEAYLTALGSADIPEEKKINVIAVMLEAYCDLSEYDALPLTDDPYVFLHEIQRESAYGQLVTNIFAGGTIDTERCFVTGSTEMVKYRAPAWSLARYLSAQGYATSFCHPGYEWFYNRQNVADYLGFDVHYFYENRYTNHNDYGAMNDAHFLPDLLTQLREANAAGRPFFNFSVTYQNHGPYSGSELMYEDTYVDAGQLSANSRYILNNYLAGVRRTGDALRALTDALREDDAPVALVFFGDHKPWLGNGNSVYTELGIDFTDDPGQGFYDYYNTPWVIWLNDAARAAAGDSFTPGDKGSFSPAFLQMELFDLLGWEGSGVVRALRELYAFTDVVNISGTVRVDGELTREPDAETAQAVARYKKLEYYLRKDYLR